MAENDGFKVEVDVLEELTIGDGVKMRLVQSHKSKIKAIQSWHSMGQRWGLMYRYGDIDAIWAKWKDTKKRIEESKKKKPKGKKK